MQRVWLRSLVPVAWMEVIFRASATPNLKTVPIAQRFGLLPQLMGPVLTDVLELLIRKSAHLLSFALLALLLDWALAGGKDWRRRAVAFALTVLYAASDEIHQLFVPGREGRVTDVLIDSSGALIALLLVSAVARRRQRARAAR
ncbi:MAG: VanZ family protein [Mycobacterium leprae]